MARRPALVNERGFTLAELLVASAVLGLIMLTVFTIQRQGLTAYQATAARVEVQQSGRAALETMFGEIRSALAVTAVATGCGTGPVPTGGGATTLSITDQSGTAIQYQLVGTELRRNGVVLVDGVERLRIWCYDAADVLTATAASVRSVHVQISTRTPTTVAANSPRNQHALMEARVRLRNL
jgi:prepilin-type N-terminal cleavage/methylation domain-containing protein